VQNSTDQTLAQLQADHQGWRIWYVVRAVSRPTILWCAKPTYETQPILNADSAESLVEQIAKHT
jgi:hypothetical protein